MIAFGYDFAAHNSHRSPTPEGAERPVPIDLSKRIRQIRRLGYEEVAGEWLEGVIDICWPIFDARGEVAAALAMPFLAVARVPPKGNARAVAHEGGSGRNH